MISFQLNSTKKKNQITATIVVIAIGNQIAQSIRLGSSSSLSVMLLSSKDTLIVDRSIFMFCYLSLVDKLSWGMSCLKNKLLVS